MSLGEGPYVWYLLRGFPPLPEVIGIYDEAPPPECDVLNAVRVANIGAVPLLLRATRARDSIMDRVGHLLG